MSHTAKKKLHGSFLQRSLLTAIALIGAILFAGITLASTSSMQWDISLFAILVSVYSIYISFIALVLGVPIFVICSAFNWTGWIATLVVGAAIGTIVVFAIPIGVPDAPLTALSYILLAVLTCAVFRGICHIGYRGTHSFE